MPPTCFRLGIAAALLASAVPAQEPPPESPDAQSRAGANQTKAIRVNEAIFEATGFGNAMMVATSEGNVIIDTSIAGQAARCRKLLQAKTADRSSTSSSPMDTATTLAVSSFGSRPGRR